MTLVLAGEHGATAHHDGGDVETGSGHEHARDYLVAVRDHHHRIEGVCLDGEFDAVGDDFTGCERVAHPRMVHRDAVTYPDGGELEGSAAGHVDAGFDRLSDLVEHQMSRDDVVDGVHDGDDRPRYLLIGQPVRLEQAAVWSPGGSTFHGLTPVLHRPPSFQMTPDAARGVFGLMAGGGSSPRERKDRGRTLAPAPGRKRLLPRYHPAWCPPPATSCHKTRTPTHTADNGCHRPDLLGAFLAKIVRSWTLAPFFRVAQGTVSRRPAPGSQLYPALWSEDWPLLLPVIAIPSDSIV